MPGYLEKTMNGDQTESNRTSCRSKSKAVPKMDPTRSLELAVMDYKKDANDKNWSNIEKVLQTLSKTSNAKLICSCPTLLMDIQWILTVNVENRKKSRRTAAEANNTEEGQNSLVTVALNLLTRLCTTDRSVSIFLRDKIRIHATLTDLLILVPLTNHQKCAKILDLLRHVTFNIKLQRQESFLQDLIARLFQHINDKDEKPKNVSLSLTILTNLCHHNYSVTTFVLSLISTEERKNLIVKHNDDPVLQVLLLRFNFCLTQANLSSQFRDINIGYYVTQILDAVCHAYNEEDCLLLQTFCDFLKDLSNESRYRIDLEKSITLEFIQQIFLVLDCSQGCNRANELIFRFAREAMSLYAGDIHSLLEIIVRTVAARLESNLNATKLAGFTDCYEAILLLNSVIRVFNVKMETKKDVKEELSASQLNNVKLHLEQITPILCSLFDLKYLSEINTVAEDEVDKLDEILNTYCAVLITLSTIAEKDDWIEIICKQLKTPSDVLGQVKSVITRASMNLHKSTNSSDPRYNNYSKCFVPIITELIHLCAILGSSFKQCWLEACQSLVSDEELVSDVDCCMKKGCHSEVIGKLLNFLADGNQMALFTKTLTKSNFRVENSFCDQSSTPMESHFRIMKQNQFIVESASQALSQPQTDIKIGEVMENISKAVTNSQVDETLADIFDLNEYRLMAHKRQIDALKASLKAADQRISESEMINVNLETEVAKLNFITKNLLRKIEVTEKELKEIKTQYHDSQDDNTEFRQNLLKELEEKTKTIDSLEEEKTKAIDKIHQYKERMINMKNTIDDLQKENTELNKKYEDEVKQKTDLQATLTKREEKLKRKEKQIQEESDVKEKQAKELDTARQELISLKQLTKRQEQALTKKDKQIQEQTEEISSFKTIQEQIFNLSKRAKV